MFMSEQNIFCNSFTNDEVVEKTDGKIDEMDIG